LPDRLHGELHSSFAVRIGANKHACTAFGIWVVDVYHRFYQEITNTKLPFWVGMGQKAASELFILYMRIS
jgi:hypothetical protein